MLLAGLWSDDGDLDLTFLGIRIHKSRDVPCVFLLFMTIFLTDFSSLACIEDKVHSDFT